MGSTMSSKELVVRSCRSTISNLKLDSRTWRAEVTLQEEKDQQHGELSAAVQNAT
jgi:hypothetical protein